MKITLYLGSNIFNFKLPYIISGSYSFFAFEDESNLINIEARNNTWVLYQTEDVKIVNGDSFMENVSLVPNSFYILQKEDKNYLIYVSKAEMSNMLAYSYDDSLNINISDQENASIKYNCPCMNNFNVKISYQNERLVLEKADKTVVYLNKQYQVQSTAMINYGDELELYGFRMYILKGLILIDNQPSVSVNLESGLTKYIFPDSGPLQDGEIKDMDLYTPNDYFSKSPRIRRLIEEKTIKLSPPPQAGDSKELPMILVVGPMLTMAVTSLTMVVNVLNKIYTNEATLSSSLPQLITSGAMLVSTLVWPVLTRIFNKKQKKKQKKEIIDKYTKYLNEKREELMQESKLQKTILCENLITVPDCLNIINTRVLNFWDKRIEQSDFLVARIGTGNELLKVKIEYPEEGFTIEESELRKKADKLVDEFKYMEMVPVGYSFYENKTTAIMGQENKIVDFVNNILLQFITFYSYDDLKIVMFTNEERKKEWEYLKYLNHTFLNDKSFRLFSSNYENSKKIAEFINAEIGNRFNQIQNGKAPIFKPHYLVIIDDYEMVKRHEFIKTLTELDVNLGFSLVILENKLSKLPSKCNNFITIGDKKSSVLKNSWENQELTNFTNEIFPNLDMMGVAKTLANIPVELENGMKQLPNSIDFLQMEKIGKVEQLNILNRWNTSNSIASLKAEVGVDEQGDLMYLDLHEKHHGPHGLIAGMTGSGKSEFIITYILSMAVNYSPDDVAFILIDYKGGGLAGAFENKAIGKVLPHLAGTITNLDKAEMDRTLVSIDSEIKRRQTIFNEARDLLGESTIDIYKYQRFYKEGRLKEPIPHLFIICDEFAELKVQQPEFMDNLISVARIGRSLGVHLILATQKPSGVVNDQIWSNTKFRVCLKVQDESDSKEMLKRPEAAHIKQTGRFYLQVGYDEYFVLGQSAWCGAKYFPSDKIIKKANKSIDFIDECGNHIKSIEASSGPKLESKGEQLAAIMNSIIEVSKQVNKKTKRLWLENVPGMILEDNLNLKYEVTHTPYELEAILGEYDAPEKQEQGIVKYNYIKDGNTIIYGNDGIEREKLLDTMIYSTTKNHTVDEVNYYIIDYGSESLRKYMSLPHIGGIVFAQEDEKYNNLLKMIKEEIKIRKKLFIEYGGEYENYIKNSPNKLPVKTIIINNYDSLYDSKPEIYEELPDLIRDSDRYGIVFIITASATNSVQSKIAQNCHNIYALRLKDSNDYGQVLGGRTKLVPREMEGRGLFRNDDIHEFQTASILENEEELNSYIMEFIKMQNAKNQTKSPRIPTLPDIVRIDDVNREPIDLKSIPVGISKKDLSVVKLDCLTNLGNIISSNKLANTEKFTKSFLEIVRTVQNTCLIVFDPNGSLKLDRTKYPNYYNSKLDEVLPVINQHIQKLKDSNSQVQGLILIYGINKFISKIKDPNQFSELTKLIKEYEKMGLIIMDDANKIKGFAFETWFTSLFNINDGIWIGRGIADQNLIHLSSITRDMTKDYKNDMGYVVTESMPTLCRLIDFITQDGEEDGK